jgi:hypothetical protein
MLVEILAEILGRAAQRRPVIFRLHDFRTLQFFFRTSQSISGNVIEDAPSMLVQRGKKDRLSRDNLVYNGFAAGYVHRY